jgi:Fic family protein
MQALGSTLREEALLRNLASDVLCNAELAGDPLDPELVQACLARGRGIGSGNPTPPDRRVEGATDVALNASRHYDRPVTADRLFDWHAALFPAGRSGNVRIAAGGWRTRDPGSGHFEGPSASRLDREMTAFLQWLNRPPDIDPVLKAGIAHLWFVTIHPFEDGNGRIGRILAEMALARSEGTPQRFCSMSTQIRQERDAYYDVLERTQAGTMDITVWMEWFLACLGRAIDGAQAVLAPVLAKARLGERLEGFALHERQSLVLGRLLQGLEGNLTTSKYAALAQCSQDTALRDILPLVARGILVRRPGGGRSTGYRLAEV